MGIAREAAPEIDRLVLFVRNLGPERNRKLTELARELGLETMELLPHFADFLVAGALTTELATLRMPYSPPSKVLDRLGELQEKNLISPGANGLAATSTMRPLLEALLAAQGEVAVEAWGGYDEDVATATYLAGKVRDAASVDHVVAVGHRLLAEPTEPAHRLAHRLLTLRYVRQHDHVAAWLARGLTAPDIVLMTELWLDNQPAEPDNKPSRLLELGFVDTDPLRLTVSGREAREAIEAETNERAQKAFDALDGQEETRFLAALRNLPGTRP
jgi:helix-turn-helix protein